MNFNLWLRGNWSRPCSFSLINQRLVQALSQRGAQVKVWDIEEPDHGLFLEEQPAPDLYVFHGFPWDLQAGPGRVNLLILNYEYPRLADPGWIDQIHSVFDAVCVPTRFVEELLLQAGLKLPILRLPWGYEPGEFYPRPNHKRSQQFTFITSGAANWRKGTDLLLQAFRQEFSAAESVRLVLLEGLRHPNWSDWLLDLMKEYDLQPDLGCGAPAIEWRPGFRQSLAAWLQKADCGVFPHRGEGFGMGALECLACGTPVIVSGGSGSDDYLHCSYSQRLNPGLRVGAEKHWLEPDLKELRGALRRAFQRGRLPLEARREIAASVADFAWERCLSGLEKWFTLNPRPGCRTSISKPTHVYTQLGTTSWRFHNRQMARLVGSPSLRANFLLGESEASYEQMRKFFGKRLLYRGGSCLEAVLQAENEERQRCGVPPEPVDPLLLWRSRQEWNLADRVLLPSQVSARLSQAYYAREKMSVLPLGLGQRRQIPPTGDALRRVLFIASRPFRKGIRPLLEAWDLLRPRGVELLCVGAREIQNSPRLLRLLVRNPGVKLLPWMSHRQILGWIRKVDLLLQPSLEDGFGVSVAEGMSYAKPAIVSDHTGISEVLRHGQDGWVVAAGDVTQLCQCLEKLLLEPEQLRRAGLQAWITAGQRTWGDYRSDVKAWLLSQLQPCDC